jgi:hypothetical protein
VFGKRVLRGTLGPERKEVTGGWRKLHNEEFILFITYYKGDKINENQIAGHEESMGQAQMYTQL